MKKIYIKFGEPIDDEDHIYVYEGLLENDIVSIILPTATYLTCQTIAKDIELTSYVVDGIYAGKANNGQIALKNYKIITKLDFDKYKERYVYKGYKDKVIDEPVEDSTKKEDIKSSSLNNIDSKFMRIGERIGERLSEIIMGGQITNSKLKTFTKK